MNQDEGARIKGKSCVQTFVFSSRLSALFFILFFNLQSINTLLIFAAPQYVAPGTMLNT